MWSLLSLRVPELPTRLLVLNGGCLLGLATVTARRARPPGKCSDRLTPASSVGPTGPERLVPPPLQERGGWSDCRPCLPWRHSPFGVAHPSCPPPPELPWSFPALDMHRWCSVSVVPLAFLKGGLFERGGDSLPQGVAGLNPTVSSDPTAELVRGWLLQAGWRAGQKPGVSGNAGLRRSLSCGGCRAERSWGHQEGAKDSGWARLVP